MRVFTLALAFALMVPRAAWAADLMYASLKNGSVVTYDISKSGSSAIASSVQVFASSSLSQPQGLAFDAAGNLYVSNIDTASITKFGPTGNLLGTIGSPLNLNNPRGLAFDTAGNLYAANWSASNSISKFNSSGTYVTSFTGLSRPIGLAFDSAGFLYAANDSGWISKLNSSGTEVFSISESLVTPNGLAFDSAGNLYAANYATSSVSKFSPSGAFISSIATNMSNPHGIVFDSSGNLYVANHGNSTISKFNSSGSFQFSWNTPSPPSFMAFSSIPVPEPSTYVLGTLASLTLAILARRRRRAALV